MTCDEFEMAIDMRLGGALEDVEPLERHLASCAGCRSYEDLAKRTEKEIVAMASEGTARIDWAKLEKRIHALEAQYRWAIWRSAIGLVVVLPVIVVLTIPRDVQPVGWAFGIALGGFIVGKTTLKRRRWIREAEAARGAHDDLLAFWRRDLDRRIRVTRLAWLQLVSTGFLILLIWNFRQQPASSAVLVALVAANVAQSLWWLIWQGPRLRRERAELG